MIYQDKQKSYYWHQVKYPDSRHHLMVSMRRRTQNNINHVHCVYVLTVGLNGAGDIMVGLGVTDMACPYFLPA